MHSHVRIGRTNPHYLAHHGTRRDGGLRISRPPRSTAPAPLPPSGAEDLAPEPARTARERNGEAGTGSAPRDLARAVDG